MSGSQTPISLFDSKALPFVSAENKTRANDVISAVNRTIPISGEGGITVQQSVNGTVIRPEIGYPSELRRLGRIIDHGPAGEPDYGAGDSRYWIQMTGLLDLDNPSASTEVDHYQTFDCPADGGITIVTAQNRLEVNLFGSGKQTHYLPVGLEVLIHQELSYFSDDYDEPLSIWCFWITPLAQIGLHCLQNSGLPTCTGDNLPLFTLVSNQTIGLSFNRNWFDVYQQELSGTLCNSLLTMVDWTGFSWLESRYGTTALQFCNIQIVRVNEDLAANALAEPVGLTTIDPATATNRYGVFFKLVLPDPIVDGCSCVGDLNDYTVLDMDASVYIDVNDFNPCKATGGGYTGDQTVVTSVDFDGSLLTKTSAVFTFVKGSLCSVGESSTVTIDTTVPGCP